MSVQTKKGRNVRLNIQEDDEERLDALCNESELTITDALTRILSAGLKALERHGNHDATEPAGYPRLTTAHPPNKTRQGESWRVYFWEKGEKVENH
jgi:hypothetical protein